MNPKSIGSKSKKSEERPDSGKATDAYMHEPPQPTTFELTQIAALLSGKSLPQDASKLARQAFQLWEACDQELMLPRIDRLLRDPNAKIISCGGSGGLPKPKSWPCSFDEALRLVMPKKRTKAERYARFRLFLRATIAGPHLRKTPSEEKTLDEIETAFKTLKQCGFKDREDYDSWLY